MINILILAVAGLTPASPSPAYLALSATAQLQDSSRASSSSTRTGSASRVTSEGTELKDNGPPHTDDGTDRDVDRGGRRGLDGRAESDDVHDQDGRVIGSTLEFDRAVGGQFSSPAAVSTRVAVTAADGTVMLPRQVFEVVLPQTGTDWEEKILLGVPLNPGGAPHKLLVLFHGYARSPLSIITESSFFQEALARGWFVIAPMGAHNFNYAIDYAQENVEYVLDWAFTYFNLDPNSVYGVGFSMGGGMAASYASRHQDPMHARFAAIVNHTGAVSVKDTYNNTPNTDILDDALMFGGPPSSNPFLYQIASSIDYDGVTVDPLTDLARNLFLTPVHNFAVLNDPLAYLVNQTNVHHSHLLTTGSPTTLDTPFGSTHAWNNLDESATLNFLDGFSLQEPLSSTPYKVLADRDGQWFHFNVTQVQTDAFSPFSFYIDLSNNRMNMYGASNVAELGFNTYEAGLDPTQTLEVVINLVGQDDVNIPLSGYSQRPSSVTRTGAGGNWTYHAATGTVTLHELGNGGGFPKWTIQP